MAVVKTNSVFSEISLSHDLPQPGLLTKEKEKHAPRLWQNQRRDWPNGLPRKRKRSKSVPSPGGEGWEPNHDTRSRKAVSPLRFATAVQDASRTREP
jgi:hypothetical protein